MEPTIGPSKRRILVVDDNQALLDTLVLFLGHCDLEVVATTRVEAALEELGQRDFEFLLLDPSVGGGRGGELLNFLGITLLRRPERVIAMSPPGAPLLVGALSAQVSARLTKPFSFDALLGALRE